MWIKKEIIVVIIAYFLTASLAGQGNLQKWSDGYLDIHHINTASGDATFFIFPDGTTMLFDLGSSLAPDNPEYFVLETNRVNSPAEIVAKYIHKIHPNQEKTVLDYALISHFHGDHYGVIGKNSNTSKKGEYKLSGITEIHEYVPIQKLIDRAYPEYDEPKGLKSYYKNDKTFMNYLKFVEYRNRMGANSERLIPGSNQQIGLNSPEQYPSFEVQNLKTNLLFWSGTSSEVYEKKLNFTDIIKTHNFNENPLSLAIKIRYGDFEYFTGGDLTGYDWRDVLDMDTPLADVLGEVDAMVLNHHGFHDATNKYFMKTLQPRIVVNQSRHTPHFQFTPLEQIVKVGADFYVNNLHNATFQLFSDQLKERIKGMNGHIVIRVSPNGEYYNVFVVDDDDFKLRIIEKHGPYKSR